MNAKWFVETHGDPLGTIQNLFIEAWERFDLETMLVSMNGSGQPHLIYDPEQLNLVNPFKPLMIRNAAKFLPQILKEHPERRIGAVLRPCEMRALQSKTRREKLPMERMLTICIDCLGTYSPEDYHWRSERKGSPDRLASETLRFARQGGIAAYRFRSACQACQTPVGSGADINIGVIGLPVRQKILVAVRNEIIAETLGKRATFLGDLSLRNQREDTIARLIQRDSHTRKRLVDNLVSILPRDLEGLIQQFERCGECR